MSDGPTTPEGADTFQPQKPTAPPEESAATGGRGVIEKENVLLLR